MKILPESILNILNRDRSLRPLNNDRNETVIFENKNFIVVLDPRITNDSYHYTAWAKENILSLIEINSSILNEILIIKNELIRQKYIKEDGYSVIHFPPNFWRLHIHFVDKNHQFRRNTKPNEIFHIDNIIKKLNVNESFFIENVFIKERDNFQQAESELVGPETVKRTGDEVVCEQLNSVGVSRRTSE